MLTMLMRPQLRYVKEVVMYALRKSTIQRVYTTRLMSDKMSMLLRGRHMVLKDGDPTKEEEEWWAILEGHFGGSFWWAISLEHSGSPTTTPTH